mmetsp:Transcript_19373/g.37099  ORF Transcript_19373/g.37099 Transcript_19373/m.37099 type:complete len:148 (+) Transcript_19373:95-538(+)
MPGYYEMMAAAALAFIPVPMRVISLVRASGGITKYNNGNPRGVVEELKAKDKLKPATIEYCARLTACQGNAWENLPVFYGAVLAANQTGVDPKLIAQACSVYLGARLLFTMCYISGSNVLGWVRSVAFLVGFMSCMRLFFLAGSSGK